MASPRIVHRSLRWAAALCCALTLCITQARAQATGACCLGGTNCIVTTDCLCKAQGGFFIGAGSTCPATVCQTIQFGACCYTSASLAQPVCVVTTGQNCLTLGGFSFTPGGTCTGTSACAPTAQPAACCCGTSCVMTNPDLCRLTGNPALIGQTCAANPCGPVTGACCTAAAGCFITVSTQCAGTFFPAVTCSPDPCTPTGFVCCNSTGGCSIVPTPSQCSGVIVPGATTCTPLNPCRGSCCDAATGACALVFAVQCTNGTYTPNGTCNPNPCPTPLGACCEFSGACIQVAAVNCPTTVGIFTPGITCTPNPCTGPCCINGVCSITIRSACNGTWGPLGGTCTPNPCTPPGFVCCLPDGSCSIVPSPTACNGFVITGVAACSPNPCLSACCRPDGSCAALTQADCVAIGGTWAFNATCSQILCTPTVACCTPNGVCLMLPTATCAAQGGFPIPGAVCTPNTICRGACCCGSSCTITPPQSCTGTGSRFAGLATACNLPGNTTTPCCKADFNQNGALTVQDLFDFLAAYFSGNRCADTNDSGTLTVQDLFDFLAAYFGGC